VTATDLLWGGAQDEDGAAASLAGVASAIVELPDGTPPPGELRDGVALDRYSATAAHGLLFERAVLPAGTVFGLRVQVELPELHREAILDALRQVAAALRDGAVRIGAAQTRGLGLLRLEGGRLYERDLSSPGGIRSALRGQPHVTTSVDDREAFPPIATDDLVVEVTWRPRLPTFVRRRGQGLAVDALPLTARVADGQVALVLPGSSIKGALRAQAERIVRTVKGTAVPDAHADQLRVELVDDLFGVAPTRDELGCQGALFVADCHSELRIDAEKWQAIVEAAPHPEGQERRRDLSPLMQATATAGLARGDGRAWLEPAQHVALDRWTQAAADGALFSVLEPHDVAWQPLRLSIDIAWLDPDRRHAALALLWLVLRDLRGQRIALGAGASRGQGWIAVDAISASSDTEWIESPTPEMSSGWDSWVRA